MTRKPQFIAMKIARVAPEHRERAVDAPGPGHHLRRPRAAAAACRPASECRAATPIGTSIATAIGDPRRARENGIAQLTSGVGDDDDHEPIAAIDDDARSPPIARSVASSKPAAPRRAEAGAEQQREQRHRQRVDRVAEQQHEPLQHRHLDQHEAGAERAEIDAATRASRAARLPRRPATSGPMTNSTTSAAEMPISVISALRPLPNSIDRPNATWN